MSQRSIRRAQQRRHAADRRRETLRRRRAGLAVTAALGATALFAPGAHAAAFEVNSLNDGAADACDSTTADGCTLRDAITDANGNGEADTITFANGLAGTITLDQTQPPLPINTEMTINGPGAGTLTVSGGDKTGIFSVNTEAPVSISGLTLSHGYSTGNGAAVFGTTRSDVTIGNSVLSANHAGNGGAIASQGHLTVTNSTITGNTADVS